MEGKYTLRVETEGMEEATEQVEKLADAYDGFPAQVTIKNCRYRPKWGERVRINCPLYIKGVTE